MCAPSTSASAIRMTLRSGPRRCRSAARARADHLDDRCALGVLEHVGERTPSDVEDLAADRQQRLELGVARELGGAERRVALDDEQLGAVVVGAAVGELRRQGRAPSAFLRRWVSLCSRAAIRVLAAATIFSSTARACALSSRVGFRRALSSRLTTSGRSWRRRGTEHLLGLALELWLGQPHGDHGGEALEDVVLDDGSSRSSAASSRAAAR